MAIDTATEIINSTASIPFYSDMGFWAVVVASVAILLSQIPPISLLLKKARIDFELYSKISLTHNVKQRQAQNSD